MTPAYKLFGEKLNKQLYNYKKITLKCKNALEIVKNIKLNKINEIHCNSKHFQNIKNKSDINNAPNTSKNKSISIIPKTCMEHWDLMLEEFNRRINLLNAVVESLQIAINNNNYYELKMWVLKRVTWSDQLPKSIIINYDKSKNIVKIKIGVENFMMIDNNNLCNCYIVAKSRNDDNMWNLYGEYNKDMYCFSPDSIPHNFAKLELSDKKKEIKEIIQIYNDIAFLIIKL